MDRQTIYSGQVVRTVDHLQQSQNAMVALAKFCGAVLGSTSILNGFTCTPTTPASLNVLVTPGEVYQMGNLEQSSWSVLNQDTSHSILKQGILLDAATFGITPPGTVGFSQNFLVEVQYQDVDSGLTLLPYFNASNPSLPYSGPGNSGTSQNTVRKGVAAVQVKAGVAAATGTQTTPTPDVGWIGAFVVTVANGAATITSGNISVYSAAPFLLTTLPNVPANIQSGTWVTYNDVGSVNAVAINMSPATAIKQGTTLRIKMATSPTGACTLDCREGSGAKSIVTSGATAIALNAWLAGDTLQLTYDGNVWFAQGLKQPGAPIYLTQNYVFYVGGTGASDSNDGLSATVTGGHGPWATLQRASNWIAQYNLNGFNITINVANGTYSSVTLFAMSGSGNVFWTGNPAAPSNVIVQGIGVSAIIAQNVGQAHKISGFKVQTSGTYTTDPMCGVNVSGTGTTVVLNNMDWGTCSGSHIAATQACVVVPTGTHNISGSPQGANAGMPSGYFIFCGTQAIVQVSSGNLPVITIPGAITMGNGGAFITAFTLCSINFVYASLTGAANVTGTRYSVSSNAILSVNGGGAMYLPGTIAGTTATGGQYF